MKHMESVYAMQKIRRCVQVRGLESLGCNVGCQQVSQCHSESKESICMEMRKQTSEASTLALKPRTGVTRMSKQGINGPI